MSPFTDANPSELGGLAQRAKRLVTQDASDIQIGPRTIGPSQREGTGCLGFHPCDRARLIGRAHPFNSRHLAIKARRCSRAHAYTARRIAGGAVPTINSCVSMPTVQRKPGPSTWK